MCIRDRFQVPDLGDLLSGNFSLLDNLRLAADGLDQVLASIQKLISGGEVFGAKLPLIGDQLKGAAGGTGAGGSGAGAGESGPAQFIQGFRDKVVQKVRDALDKSVQKTGQVIRQALWDILGTPGLDIVLDGPDGGTGVSIDDIVMTGDSIEFLQWDFKLGQTKPFNNAIDFDLGLPGLKLDATGN